MLARVKINKEPSKGKLLNNKCYCFYYMKLQLTGPLCQPINTIQKVLDDVTLHQFTSISAHSLSKVKGVYFVVGGRTKLSSNKDNENS